MISDIQLQKPRLPFKSVAAALLFSFFLGPIGLLYSTVLGGAVMTVLVFICLGHKLFGLVLFSWIVCCVWSTAATNRYNKKILLSFH